jgi:hypothetical protein
MENRLLAPDLHAYLLFLGSLLEKAGSGETAKRALLVSRYASGSSSELYGEARAFLAELLKGGARGLSKLEAAKVREVLKAIDAEFSRIGGA